MNEVETAMPKDSKDSTSTQVTVRLNNEWLPRLDGVVAHHSRPGLELTTADALRMTIARGLDAIEADIGSKTKSVSTKAEVLKAVGRLSKKRLEGYVTIDILAKDLGLDALEIGDALGELFKERHVRRVTDGSSVRGYALSAALK